MAADVIESDFRMPTVRHVESIVEPAEQGQTGIEDTMGKNAEHLLWQWVFGYAVMVVKPCLSCPANVERAGNVGAAPVEYAAQFFPISDFLEVQMLERCAGNDETVEQFVLHVLEVAIKGLHVFRWRVLACVRPDFHQVDVERQRRGGKDAREISFRRYLYRHQIQDGDAQRTNVRTDSHRTAHDEDIFFLEQFYGR